jgi:hypothetical protein
LSIVDIQPVPESDNIRSPVSCRPPDSGRNIAEFRQALAGFGQNGQDLDGSGQTFSPESGSGNRTLPDSGSICQTLIFAFCNFFVRAKHKKKINK